MRSSLRGTDPRHVIVRRCRAAKAARNAIYGCDARPLGRKLRFQWVRLISWYTRSRALTFRDVQGIADVMGLELRMAGKVPVPSYGPNDYLLRMEFSRRLVEATRRKAASRWPRDDEEHRDEQEIARFGQAMKQVFLDAGAPIDGRGGVIVEGWPGLRRG